MNSLKNAWESWKKIALVIGNFQARLILSILYFLMVAPVGLIVRAFADPLGQKTKADSHWIAREETVATLEDARGQF